MNVNTACGSVRRVNLFLLRHARSVSNEFLLHPCASINGLARWLRDPPLSRSGVADARAYAPGLQARLRQRMFLTDRTLVCASGLLRAQQTARLLFGREPLEVPHFGEMGTSPENTPERGEYRAPDFARYLRSLSSVVGDGDTVVTVGHGLFLSDLRDRLAETGDDETTDEWEGSNLDGYMVTVDMGPGGTLSLARLGESLNHRN